MTKHETSWQFPRILFLHQPKTGGISLRTTIAAQYPKENTLEIRPNPRIKTPEDLKNELPGDLSEIHFIHGHTIWGIHNFVPSPFIYITMLRDPIERIISLYYYVRSTPSHRLFSQVKTENISLEGFLALEGAFGEIENQQTKLLAGKFAPDDRCTADILEQAKDNLDRFFIVGLTEQYDKSLRVFSNLFGWENADVIYANVTPVRPRRHEVSQSILDKIREYNFYDIGLYSFAQKMLEEQVVHPERILSKKYMQANRQ